jgi:hypothetical protein
MLNHLESPNILEIRSLSFSKTLSNHVQIDCSLDGLSSFFSPSFGDGKLGAEGAVGALGAVGKGGGDGEAGVAGAVGSEGGFTVAGPVPSAGRSSGVSNFGAFSSECSPTGLNGSLSWPLLGLGSIPSESQIILYTSMFSQGC